MSSSTMQPHAQPSAARPSADEPLKVKKRRENRSSGSTISDARGLLRKMSIKRVSSSLHSRSKSTESALHSSAGILTSQSSSLSLTPESPPPGPSRPQVQATSSRPGPPRLAQQLRPTAPPPILSVHLHTVAEADSICMHDERTIWVAVEAHGVVKIEAQRNALPDPNAGIDVVVILDDSRFASRQCLDNACDIALRIVQLTTGPDDRIAIFCTTWRHPYHSLDIAGRQLLPLGPPCLETARTELQATKLLATHAPHAANLDRTISAAVRMLTETGDPDTRPLRADRSHIIILSPDPAACGISWQELAPIKVNYICPAVVPYSAKVPNARAWHIVSPPWHLAHSPEGIDPYSHVSITSQISDILAQARSTNTYGEVTDLRMKIKAHPDCTIDAVLGSTSTDRLRAGETVTFFLRVKIAKASKSTGQADDLTEAFDELEALLGETIINVVTVEARYKQSLFSNSSAVMIQNVCRLRRPNLLSPWSLQTRPDDAASNNQEAELYKRLAYFIAVQNTPQQALTALSQFFARHGSPVTCSEYFVALQEELAHQAQAVQRAKAAQESPVPATSTGAPATSLRSTSLSLPFHPHFSFEGRQSLRFAPILEGAANTPPPLARSVSDSPLTVVHNTSPPTAAHQRRTSEDSLDEARQIWRRMRRDSRDYRAGAPGVLGGLSEMKEVAEVEEQEPYLKELKRKALANKRSIGADTLRSLAMSTNNLR